MASPKPSPHHHCPRAHRALPTTITIAHGFTSPPWSTKATRALHPTSSSKNLNTQSNNPNHFTCKRKNPKNSQSHTHHRVLPSPAQPSLTLSPAAAIAHRRQPKLHHAPAT
ncbi:hypothetical protein M0R45_026561 [Rubus argutus]|uniref:Uncharacterized protein n=1 Tax=Rubus argutus TaxID=59490 RepID=A0AAW1WZN4_RUBAR